MKIKLWAATDRLGCNIKPEAHPAIQSRRLTAVVLAAGVTVALNANIDINFSGVRIATCNLRGFGPGMVVCPNHVNAGCMF
jgi:hypothetical protein